MILAIVGPTGVGKTKLSVELAKYYNGIIINADAVQIFKSLDIGSAKVREEEKCGISHLLFDIKNPDEDYTVKNYQTDARKIIEEYKGKNIIFCGGTGLYLSAALMDYRFYEDEDTNTYDDLTNDELYGKVLAKYPDTKIDKNNRVRLIRALNKKNMPVVDPKMLYENVIIIGLTTQRDKLYDIINKRVDDMFDKGLLDEVKSLYAKYPTSRVLKSAIGYKEVIGYLNCEYSLEEAKELIKKNSRHYAKRQYTWFNNKMNVTWFNVNYDNFDETIKDVKNYIDKVV